MTTKSNDSGGSASAPLLVPTQSVTDMNIPSFPCNLLNSHDLSAKEYSIFCTSPCPSFGAQYRLQQKGNSLDVWLRSGKALFKAHKSILSAKSIILENRLVGNVAEINFDLNPKSLHRLLIYFYTDVKSFKQNLDWNEALEILEIAKECRLMRLEEECCSFLRDHFQQRRRHTVSTQRPPCNSVNSNDSVLCCACSTLHGALESLQKQGFSPDVRVRSLVNTEVAFDIHKNRLSAKSTVFESMLVGNVPEIGINLNAQCLHHLLTYIYIGAKNFKKDLVWTDALEILDVAHEYQMMHLEEECCSFLAEYFEQRRRDVRDFRDKWITANQRARN